jgi:hypothetical protein
VRSLVFEWVVVKPSSISPDKSLSRRLPWLSSQDESKPSFEQTWINTIAVLTLLLLTTRISIGHHNVSLLGICRIVGLGERISLASGYLCSPAAHDFPSRPLVGKPVYSDNGAATEVDTSCSLGRQASLCAMLCQSRFLWKGGSYMTSADLVRWCGLAAILGAALFIIADLIDLLTADFDASPSEFFTSFGFYLASALFLVGGPLVLLGLVGLYAYRPEAMGVLGIIAFLGAFSAGCYPRVPSGTTPSSPRPLRLAPPNC